MSFLEKDDKIKNTAKSDTQILRESGGRFPKGISGNRKGRPKGSKNKSTAIKLAIENDMVERIQQDAIEVLESVIEAAKGGDMSAAKILMDRLWPVVKNPDTIGDKSAKGGNAVNIVISGLEARADIKTIEGEIADDGRKG